MTESPEHLPARILIAEDDPVSRKVLESFLHKWHYDLVIVADGTAAWDALQQPDAPPLAVLDWMMPGIDGVELCQRIRQTPNLPTHYVILLTAKGRPEEMLEGLRAGADDYIIKPFDPAELRARIEVGIRVVELQANLEHKVTELETALVKVNQLQGLLPICSYCKKIRTDDDSYQQLEAYISEHSDAEFTHGICPDCYQEHIVPQLIPNNPEQ